MFQLNFHQTHPINNFSPTFCARKLVLKEVTNYTEKLKINKIIEDELNKEFYKNCQPHLPHFIKAFSSKVERFFNILTTPFLDIKKLDILGLYDENSKIVGGVIGRKLTKNYHVGGLFLDDSIKRTKDSPRALIMIMNKIKDIAKKRNAQIISCDVYRNAYSTRRLYKKAGFKEVNKKSPYDSLLTIDLEVKTKDFGKNLSLKTFKK